MNHLLRWNILVPALLVLCIPAVSAFTLDSYTRDPPGPLTPNTTVSVSYTIGFAPVSDATFPSGSDLVLTTDLANPRWTYTLVLEGVENPRGPSTGTILDISGFELSYPSKINESIRGTLTGTVPDVSSSAGKVILDVHEIDSNGTAGTRIIKTADAGSALPTTAATPALIQTIPPMPSHPDNPLDQILGMFNGLFKR